MLPSLTKLFGSRSNPAREESRASKQRFQPAVEALEARQLMTIALANGILSVTGSDNKDVVYLSLPDNNHVTATRTEYDANGNVLTYESNTYDRLTIYGGIRTYLKGGADHYENNIPFDHPYLYSVVEGGEGKDTIWGSTNSYGESLYGQGGDDKIYDRAGTDVLSGGLGNDLLDGGAGADTLVESGDVNMTLSNSQLLGLGTDRLKSLEEARLTGGDSSNTLNAKLFTGKVTLYGGKGDDVLHGGSGNDFLYGEGGLDTLYGRGGHDYLDGGKDGYLDVLFGGDGIQSLFNNGADTFKRYYTWVFDGFTIYRKYDEILGDYSAAQGDVIHASLYY